jgi:hypothetical protein
MNFASIVAQNLSARLPLISVSDQCQLDWQFKPFASPLTLALATSSASCKL